MPSGRTKALIAIVVGAFCFWLFLNPWQQQNYKAEIYTLQGSTMGTTWSLQLPLKNLGGSADYEQQLSNLAATLSAKLLHLDKEIFSTYSPQSELSQLNAAPIDTPIKISVELYEVLEAAQKIYSASHGAFDPSIGPLVSLWGFGPHESNTVIDEASIEKAIQQLGTTKLQLIRSAYTANKHSAITLDLSAIAKGYATDQLADYLLSQGYANFLLEIGGEIRAHGNKTNKDDWQLAIEKPLTGRREAQFILNTQGRALAIAGSGDYRNYREFEGKRVSHEIDPRNGYPINHQLAAVTVISESAMLADAWATALMILGPEDGLTLADGLGLSAYFIIRVDNGFRTTYSSAFTQYAEYIHP